MSSGSNTTIAAIRLSALISTSRALGAELPRTLIAVRETDTTEGEALAAGRNDGSTTSSSQGRHRPHVRDFGVSTMSDPRAHDPTAIVG